MRAYYNSVVPLDGILRQTGQASRSSGFAPDPFSVLSPGQHDMSGPNRKVNEPNVRPAPRMVMKVCTQIVLLLRSFDATSKAAHGLPLSRLYTIARPLQRGISN